MLADHLIESNPLVVIAEGNTKLLLGVKLYFDFSLELESKGKKKSEVKWWRGKNSEVKRAVIIILFADFLP